MKNRILREYIESLKEDNELDYIFPILLQAMGFRIVSTPRNSKGQPQHGKDIVAIGYDTNNIIYRWYFELKGNGAKDITTTNFYAEDGVRDSLLEAKDVAYDCQSIPKFDELPVKIVFVHNGILQANAEPAFNGFIKNNYSDVNFERWDIERLTLLFSEHLFEECIFADDVCYTLFKKVLVMLDAPGWNTNDIDRIIDIFLTRCPISKTPNKRIVNKTFAGLNLILAIIFKNCEECGNLLPAKWSSDRIILKTWSWILQNKVENRKIYYNNFMKIYDLHITIYDSYIQKLLPMALSYKGLYQPMGTYSERVCYPLRCYDFLNDLLYYYLSTEWFGYEDIPTRNDQLRIVTNIIKQNSGFDVPLLDNHSITLVLLTRFVWACGQPEDESVIKDYFEYIDRLCANVILRHKRQNIFPEFYNNIKEVCASMFKKSEDYVDSSSMYLLVLVEILAFFRQKTNYKYLRKEINASKVNLQIPLPIFDEYLEVNLFDHHLHNEMCVKSSICLPDTLEAFLKIFKIKYKPISFRTEKIGLSPLLLLAHIHYKTEFFPNFVDFGFLET